MRKFLPLCAGVLLFSFQTRSQAVNPYTNCPNVNIAILRAGLNADNTNPYHLYNVNTTTGAMTQVAGGPYKEPANPAKNLQVNAVGVNRVDGFIYGLSVETTITTSRLLRLDKTYGVTDLGYIPSPASAFGQIGFVNTAAGDMDASGNFYFTAGIMNVFTGQLTNFSLGKISNVQQYTTAPVLTEYYEILTTAGCTNYTSTFTTDPNNSGLKDFSYNPFTNSFFSYATYKPSGAPNFSGQMIELKPVAGSNPLKYDLTCTQVVNQHTSETSGTLIDNAGNFLVLMTDGTVGKITAMGSFEYTGQYTVLNNTTGLPNPLRGDMASCSSPMPGPLPVQLSSFTVANRDCQNNFSWTAENEVAFNRYELEQSIDNVNYNVVSSVASRNSTAATTYKVKLPSASRPATYRLKMIDNNGRFVYSRTLAVNNSCGERFEFALLPNPVSSLLNLHWYGLNQSSRVDIMIFNSSGMVVERISKNIHDGSSYMQIPVQNLTPGSYLIKAVDARNNRSFSTRFIKQ